MPGFEAEQAFLGVSSVLASVPRVTLPPLGGSSAGPEPDLRPTVDRTGQGSATSGIEEGSSAPAEVTGGPEAGSDACQVLLRCCKAVTAVGDESTVGGGADRDDVQEVPRRRRRDQVRGAADEPRVWAGQGEGERCSGC